MHDSRFAPQLLRLGLATSDMRTTPAALVLLLVVVSVRGFHGAERLPSRGVLDGRHLRRSLNAVYNLRGGNGPVLDATEPIDIETELELEEALEAAGDLSLIHI